MENLSIKKVLVKLLSTKMVIESGTSGIWTYRKWSDGTAECWGSIAPRSWALTSSYGGNNAYYTSGSVDLPSGLFKTVTDVSASRFSATNAGGLIDVDVNAITVSNLTFYVWDAASGTKTFGISFFIIGTWATRETDPENPDYQLLNIDGFVQNQMSKAEVQALIEASGNIFKENDTWIPSNLT